MSFPRTGQTLYVLACICINQQVVISLFTACLGAAYSPLSSENEERSASLCDSGMPDTDVCNVLLTPSVQQDILQEAWARGCVF